MNLNWDHIYLLFWYGEKGESYLTTWVGDSPIVRVVVCGLGPTSRVPLWNAYVPPGAELRPLPQDIQDHQARLDYAKSIGGYLAGGWYCEQPITRHSSA